MDNNILNELTKKVAEKLLEEIDEKVNQKELLELSSKIEESTDEFMALNDQITQLEELLPSVQLATTRYQLTKENLWDKTPWANEAIKLYAILGEKTAKSELFSKSKDYLELALSLDEEDHYNIRFTLAYVYYMLGEIKEIKRCFIKKEDKKDAELIVPLLLVNIANDNEEKINKYSKTLFKDERYREILPNDEVVLKILDYMIEENNIAQDKLMKIIERYSQFLTAPYYQEVLKEQAGKI